MSDTPFCDILRILRMCCHGEAYDSTLAVGDTLVHAALVLCWIDRSCILMKTQGSRNGKALGISELLASARAALVLSWIDHGCHGACAKLKEW